MFFIVISVNFFRVYRFNFDRKFWGFRVIVCVIIWVCVFDMWGGDNLCFYLNLFYKKNCGIIEVCDDMGYGGSNSCD